eukprot:8414405-Ditylum_brightwellii.AAC.1
MSQEPKKGGCKFMKSLSATENLTIYRLSRISKNPHHTTSAVISEKTATAKKLKEKYGFSKIQREKYYA